MNELSSAAIKQYINARQTFTAYEQAVEAGGGNVERLRKALLLHQKLNVVYEVGNVDLSTMNRLNQVDMKDAVVVGIGALYAYEAAAGIRIDRDAFTGDVAVLHNYPAQPYEAIVVGVDGSMARMRVMQPSDYAKTDNPHAALVQQMVDDYRLYTPDSEESEDKD